jgi:hypothetical protein
MAGQGHDGERSIVAEVRLLTGEPVLPQGHAHGVLMGTGRVPQRALAALEGEARGEGAYIARNWAEPPPGQGSAGGSRTADFILSGVRLVAGRVAAAGTFDESEDGWLAYGTLIAVSGRLRWDDEPR